MKKLSSLILVLVFFCGPSFLSAQYHQVAEENINLMTGSAAMQMDLVSYGDTAYEALVATDDSSFSELSPILINKYVDNVYDSTLCITVEDFICYEFKEYYSHYDYLKLYALGPDDLVLTVYYSYSTNYFVFFRIKDGRVILSKGYNLKGFKAYEEQKYAFNGKDRIYVAFNGSNKKYDNGRDLFLLAFDLEGNLVKSVSIMTPRNDEVNGLAALGDYVYFSIRAQAYEQQAILQLDKNLNYEKCLALKYQGSGIRFWDLYSDDENLIVDVYKENDIKDYLVRYSSDGSFVACYEENFLLPPDEVPQHSEPYYDVHVPDESDLADLIFRKKYVSKDGITFLCERFPSEALWTEGIPSYYSVCFMDWEGNKAYEYEFTEKDCLDLRKAVLIGDRYFCTGEYVYEDWGISHIAYSFIIGEKYRDIDYGSFTKTDVNPFALPTDPDAKKWYDFEEEFWKDNLSVVKVELPAWDHTYTDETIQLNLQHLRPDTEEAVSGIPVFPFSER